MTWQQSNPQYYILSFAELQKYKKHLSELICYRLFKIFQDCNEKGLRADTLLKEVEQLHQKLKSPQFRLAIVGEFSRGKSTLVNALVSEQIQPVRAIACSGAITVLKHGLTKRIICHYKNGKKQEISFEEYHKLASISKEAALQHRSDELAHSQIEEIIFEHPNLEFCKNGVEIIDSPGLNEHPERALITQKLLNNIDAVIFLTFASAPLSETERELIHDLRMQLSGYREKGIARNLFIVVNKMDELDSDEDRQDVKDLVEKFAWGRNPIVANNNRIHFISAKAALKAKLNNEQNEHIKVFDDLTKSIEEFLTSERGSTEITQAIVKVEEIIKMGFNLFQQSENDLNQIIEEADIKKQRIIEKIGELSGQSIRIDSLIKKWIMELEEQLRKQLEKDWNTWIHSPLRLNLYVKAINWTSSCNPVWEQNGIVKDYIKLFNQDLLEQIINWVTEHASYLEHKLQILDDRIYAELKILGRHKIDITSVEEIFSQQFNYGFNFQVTKQGGYGDFLSWIGSILVIGKFLGSNDFIVNQIKEKVIGEGLGKFHQDSAQMFNQIYKTVPLTFEIRRKRVKEIIDKAISGCEVELLEQDKDYQKLLLYCEPEKAWISQKRQELEQVQKNIEAIFPS